MNVRPDQLENNLKKKICPVYLISGDEPLQQMECADRIRACAREQGYTEREIIDVDAKFEWQNFTEQAASLSLFASQRVLDVRIPSAKPGRQGSAALKQYLDNVPDDIVLLITSGKLDSGSKNSAWFKAIDNNGIVVQCWPIGPDQLPAWVEQRFRLRDMEAEREVVDYVCEHVEGNLLAAAQEIDKLRLIVGAGKINFDDVRDAITENSRFSVFELVDCALRGNRKRVIKVLDSLRAEGVEPIMVTWALAKDIRLLASVAANSASAEHTLSRSGVWKNRMPLFTASLSRHTEKSFQSLLKRCASVDGMSKGFKPGNVWDELRIVCYRLAGATNAHATNRT